MVRSQALGADVQASGHLVNRLVTKQRHAKHQPEHLVSGQPTPADGGLAGKIQRGGDPLNGNIWGEGAQVAEDEKVAEVEQVLLNRHKKIRCQKSGIGFSEKPGADSNA